MDCCWKGRLEGANMIAAEAATAGGDGRARPGGTPTRLPGSAAGTERTQAVTRGQPFGRKALLFWKEGWACPLIGGRLLSHLGATGGALDPWGQACQAGASAGPAGLAANRHAAQVGARHAFHAGSGADSAVVQAAVVLGRRWVGVRRTADAARRPAGRVMAGRRSCRVRCARRGAVAAGSRAAARHFCHELQLQSSREEGTMA